MNEEELEVFKVAIEFIHFKELEEEYKRFIISHKNLKR